MSLNYDFTNIKRRKANFPDHPSGQLNPILQSLVFASIPCGFNEITEANAAEVWARVNLWQRAVGAWFNTVDDHDQIRPVLVTSLDVTNAIGLRTNATRLTKTRFLNNLWDVFNRM